jgi:hypothetical protein
VFGVIVRIFTVVALASHGVLGGIEELHIQVRALRAE